MKRVRLANLGLADLPEGRYRSLDEEEVSRLRQAVDRAAQPERTRSE